MERERGSARVCVCEGERRRRERGDQMAVCFLVTPHVTDTHTHIHTHTRKYTHTYTRLHVHSKPLFSSALTSAVRPLAFVVTFPTDHLSLSHCSFRHPHIRTHTQTHFLLLFIVLTAAWRVCSPTHGRPWAATPSTRTSACSPLPPP